MSYKLTSYTNDPVWGQIFVTPIKRSVAKCKSGFKMKNCFRFGDIFVAKQNKNTDKTLVNQLVTKAKVNPLNFGFMNIKYLFLFFLIGLTNFSFSQIKLSGNITDSDKLEPLPGAAIYIPSLKTGVIADDNGFYKIDDLKAGNYILEVSFFDCKTITKEVNLTKDTIINFQLSPSVTEYNEVVVTGVTRSTKLKQSPITIKTVNNEVFKENSASNLIDALKTVPGIDQISTGTSVSKPVIRGLGFNRVISLNNGIRQEGQQWGDEHGIEIDEYSINRVEIVKGPGSLMYGSDGIAGVLNFLSIKPISEGKIESQIISNYQTNNQLLGYSISNRGNKNGIQWLARLSNKYAGNYQNKYDGKVFNSGFNELNGNLFLGVNKNWGFSHFTVSSFNTTLGMVEGERNEYGEFIYDNEFGEEQIATSDDLSRYKIWHPYQKIHHLNISSNNHILLKKGILDFTIGYQNNIRKEFEDASEPEDIELFLDLNTTTYNFKYHLEKIKGWETSVGISGMYQLNKNNGEEYLIPDYKLFDIGSFLFTQKTIKKVIVAAGVRFDNRWLNSKGLTIAKITQFSPFHATFNGFSGSVGLSYLINQNSTLKFNLSRGFRSPNIAELASNGVHEGTFRYEIGNSNLKSENSHQVDLGYYFDAEHVTLEITPFLNYIQNYIYLQKLQSTLGGDSIMDIENPVPTFQFVSGNSLLYGGEVFIDFHPHPLDWLHVENSFSFVEGIQNLDQDKIEYLPFIPAPKYRGEIKAKFNKIGNSLTNAYIKFGVSHYFKKEHVYTKFDTETSTPGYTLLSAGIGVNIKAFKRRDGIEIYFSGENLADISYQSHLSRLKYAPSNPQNNLRGVYNMGRNFSVKLIVNI